jgi:hypothetical protein
MTRLSTPEVKMPIQNDDFEQRCRLVVLVYDVLRDMETPAADATNTSILSALSLAFSEKAAMLDEATAQPNRERARPTERQKVMMFSMAAE